jgi:hypothetical protein
VLRVVGPPLVPERVLELAGAPECGLECPVRIYLTESLPIGFNRRFGLSGKTGLCYLPNPFGPVEADDGRTPALAQHAHLLVSIGAWQGRRERHDAVDEEVVLLGEDLSRRRFRVHRLVRF